jgi:MFS family permease
VVAIPVALLIDRYRRDSSLRFSGFIGVLAIAATFYAFLFNSLVYLWPSLVLWGMFDAVSSPALESIFADSVASGSRSRVFSNKYIAQTVAGSLGPLLSVALFYYLGNNWSIETLRIVLLTGTGILVVPVFVLFSFSDDASLPEELRVDEAAPTTANAQSSPLVQRAHGSPLVTRFVATSSPARSNTSQLNERLLHQPSLDSSSVDDKPESESDIARRRIPIWMALIDILIALGAGMTIKYFPLFFLEELALAPISVSLLFFITPLVTAIFTFCSTRLARHIGRAQTTLLSYVLGTGTFLFL